MKGIAQKCKNNMTAILLFLSYRVANTIFVKWYK